MARDLSRSRAILIGNAVFRHRQIEDLPAAAGCVVAMAGLLTGELCGWPAGRVVRLEDVAKPDDLARRVIAAVRDAEDVLLVYYSGHGYRTRNGRPDRPTANDHEVLSGFGRRPASCPAMLPAVTAG